MGKKTNWVTFFIFLTFIFLLAQTVTAQKNKTIPINVGVVLDLDTGFGKMGLSCVSMALSDFYASNGNFKTRIVLNSRDSRGDVVGAAGAGTDFGTKFLIQFFRIVLVFDSFLC